MLASHGCAIDKKNRRGQSTLEYLAFVPLQAVSEQPLDIQGNLRATAGQLKPYGTLYLGTVEGVGEAYVPLNQPYTIPAQLFRTELHEYNAAEAGSDAGFMVRPTVNDTRTATLSAATLRLFWRKWAIYWTGVDPLPDT